MVSDLIDNYPDSFAVVYYFVNNAGYDTPWGNDRGDLFYNIWGDGIPWFAYDGLFDAWPISNYEPALISRQAVATDVTMDLTGIHIGNDTYEVTAEVCIEPGGTAKTMRIYMVQVVDKYPADQVYYRNYFQQAAPTEDVLVDPNSCVEVTQTFTLDSVALDHIDDVKIISWAQTPNASIPAEIHQGAKMAWPFPGVFTDGCESGDTGAWSVTSP